MIWFFVDQRIDPDKYDKIGENIVAEDTKTSFYYLADGTNEWVTLSHGGDGCFGTGDGGSQGMKGKKGYFAFAIDDKLQGGKQMTSDTLVMGFYMYMSISSNSENVIYIDNIMLVTDYTAIELQ